MADWSYIEGQGNQPAVNAAASAGVSVTSSTTANTKGAWTELLAASAEETALLLIRFGHTGTAVGQEFLMDLGVGASSSEQVIVPNLVYSLGSAAERHAAATLALPLAIPAGTRLAARVQTTSTGGALALLTSLVLVSQGLLPGQPVSQVDTYGADTSDSGGISIDPSSSPNADGAWVQMSSGVARDIVGLVMGVGNQRNTARGDFDWLLDIGVGAAASEQVLISDFHLHSYSSPDLVQPNYSQFIPCHVPAGTRLAARARCSGTDATDRLFDLILYAVS